MKNAVIKETEAERKMRIRNAVNKRLKEIGEPHPIGCFLNHFYIDEWLDKPEQCFEYEEYDEETHGSYDEYLYGEDIKEGRLYGGGDSCISDLEEDHFWGIEDRWIYNDDGMRVCKIKR